ncbi:hypothetical protein KMZ32_05385 [Phycicoccus sp. MAQZ13P-2]|uniref:hypothetical protein n=1 Tax=Phycicoccus mangrovi TaxID=2840470 RepID=UPI001BFFF55C|nr:hypothetical protein [Phycicoccus mangrovi]MBT9255461.1 hypothetical protein [Phycicoccus mangrovi]MBT9273509.1 hypothetical protein [Phycicoccus mangrovi]
MRRRLTSEAVRAAAVTTAAALAAAGATIPASAASPPVAAPRVAAVAPPAVDAATFSAPQRVRLITGDVVTLPGAGRPLTVTRSPGSRSSFSVVRTGDHTYVVPSAVRPLVGRLDLSLFDARALAATPARTPVTVTYDSTSTPTAVPGVSITKRTGRTATGVVTPASSAALAKALRTRSAASVFRGVAGITAAAPTVRPTFPMHTVKVRLVGAGGAPVEGLVILANVDDMRKAVTFGVAVGGEARVSVPAGHYQAAALFGDETTSGLVVQPEALVSGPGTLRLDTRAATARPSVTTPQPTDGTFTSLDVSRVDAKQNGSLSLGMLGFDGQQPLYSPVRAGAVVHGSLDSAYAFMGAERGQPATPSYLYELGTAYPGELPASIRLDPAPTDLMQVTHSYRGSTSRSHLPSLVENGVTLPTGTGIGVGFFRSVPTRMTVWSGGDPGVTVSSAFTASFDWETFTGSEYLTSADRPVVPGTSRSEEWNRRPSHPSILRPSGAFPVCGACLQAGYLSLVVPSFSDNDPDHWGLVDDPSRVAWSVSTGGTVLRTSDGPLVDYLRLPRGTAPVVVEHRERMRRIGFPDSTTTTRWEVPRKAGSAVPGAQCPDGVGPCRSLGMLEPRYRLPIGVTGAMSSGRHTGTLTIAPFLSNTEITSLAVDVRYGSGPWTTVPYRRTGPTTFALDVQVPRSGGPASLRVRANDSASSTVSQTITRAWTVAP